jgi:hypothetical protein
MAITKQAEFDKFTMLCTIGVVAVNHLVVIVRLYMAARKAQLGSGKPHGEEVRPAWQPVSRHLPQL